ncbi:TIGR03089 family protein [Actinotalea solisilvae]|uniref:TIGR03089 family protein n=1 Tax=Actinotalea solisilvae TaxID=2072922 RepID=UPI0027DE7FEE|nr:TIGR03089 family protein [Actinotalea solisilvae]
MPTPSPARDLPHLLDRLEADPGRPRLTWYGPGGERIELSGHVLVNWVTKTTNLLVEELDAGPGTRVLVDLPPHWRTVVWALAAWRAGACVVLTGRGPGGAADGADAADAVPCDVVVTDRPQAHPGAGRPDVVAVALPALARRWEGELPTGALDAASSVMTYGDALGFVPPRDAAAPAVAGPGAADGATHAALLGWATAAGAGLRRTPGPERVLLEPTDHGVDAVLGAALAALADDGSVVLLAPAVTAELAGTPARREALVAGERVTG